LKVTTAEAASRVLDSCQRAMRHSGRTDDALSS
jgi:hypothetical protein